MREAESEVIKSIIGKHHQSLNFKVAINLGSGNVEQLRQLKPWVEKNLYQPLLSMGVRVINIDACGFPGVDLVIDLNGPNALEFSDRFEGPRLFILCNVLEHVTPILRSNLLSNIYSKMKTGDALLVSVPNDYPYHPDPIDTMFRPYPAELVKLIPLDWKDQLLITSGSYREEFLKLSLLKKTRKLLKPLLLLQKPQKWLESHRLLYLFKDYKITIVFGVKSPALQ